MKKRILCTILTLALVLSATAMPAFAKTGEIYSFDFEETAIGQVTDKAQLDNYFNIINNDTSKAYTNVVDGVTIETPDITKSLTNNNVNVTTTDGIWTITGKGTTGGTSKLAFSTTKTTPDFVLSYKLLQNQTAGNIQIGFGSVFQITYGSTEFTITPYIGTGMDSSSAKTYAFPDDYIDVKVVVKTVNGSKVTDIYFGDTLMFENLNVRTGQGYSEYGLMQVQFNSAGSKGSVSIKDIKVTVPIENKALQYIKTSSGPQEATMTFGTLLNKYFAEDYTLSFDMRPELTAGSFNLAFGAFFEIARTADNVYTISDRQGSATSTTEVKTGVEIDDFVKVKIKIVNGKGNLYFDDVLIDENVEYRNNYTPETFRLVFNNAMRGSVYIDNIQLFVDSEQDVEPYVTGTYNLNSAGTGYQLNIKAFAPSDSVGNSFRAYVAYYADAEQTEFLGATLQDVVPGELVTRGFGSSIPKGSKSANIMLWNDSLAPLCDYVTVELVAPAAE